MIKSSAAGPKCITQTNNYVVEPFMLPTQQMSSRAENKETVHVYTPAGSIWLHVSQHPVGCCMLDGAIVRTQTNSV